MTYIATFYSHFGAIRFRKEASRDPERGISRTRMMPVPRSLSSSCGTCVRFEAGDDFVPAPDEHGEIEQIVRDTGQGYEVIYMAENM